MVFKFSFSSRGDGMGRQNRSRATYRHFENHLLGGLPGQHVELLNLVVVSWGGKVRVMASVAFPCRSGMRRRRVVSKPKKHTRELTPFCFSSPRPRSSFPANAVGARCRSLNGHAASRSRLKPIKATNCVIRKATRGVAKAIKASNGSSTSSRDWKPTRDAIKNHHIDSPRLSLPCLCRT